MQLLDDRVAIGTPIILYGGAGIGKSTLASKAPNPVFIDIENGLRRIPGVKKTPLITSWDAFQTACREFIASDFKTVVVDTLDVLETLLHAHICKQNNWKSIEQPGYGKGYAVAAETWCKFCSYIDSVVNANKNIILIAHEQIKAYTAPDQDVYDRYSIKINKASANILISKVDAVLFAQNETVVRDDKTKEDRVRAVSTGKRFLRTQEAAAYVAKNRFDLSPIEPFDSTIFEKLCFAKTCTPTLTTGEPT